MGAVAWIGIAVALGVSWLWGRDHGVRSCLTVIGDEHKRRCTVALRLDPSGVAHARNDEACATLMVVMNKIIWRSNA